MDDVIEAFEKVAEKRIHIETISGLLKKQTSKLSISNRLPRISKKSVEIGLISYKIVSFKRLLYHRTPIFQGTNKIKKMLISVLISPKMALIRIGEVLVTKLRAKVDDYFLEFSVGL